MSSDYQIFVFKRPYDYFHENTFARQLLCDTWALKLKGYRRYFPYGVLPIDHLDFVSNHIVCCRKDIKNDVYQPVMGVKNLTLETYQNFKLDFPIYKHLFCGEREKYHQHISAIQEWSKSSKPADIAYSMGFTIDPDMDKAEKKELIDLGWAFFFLFYQEVGIKNVIHGVSKTFKLDQESSNIGFKYLQFQGQRLPSIKTESYNNVESEVMTLNLDEYNTFAKAKYLNKFSSLWDQRILFAPEKSTSNSKAS
jgi:hypothetical protein